ncbi:hypothetical protein [Bizionia saleffrena]|uniref:hypothetical protein n=1 Tax=Bizionia saleffrena TaxID=291189 RepID=UPI0014789D2F|nr:hypothetical protein [Bizionia saleffrena]
MKSLKITFIALFSLGLFTALASTVTVTPTITSNTELAPTDVHLATTSHKVKISVPANG